MRIAYRRMSGAIGLTCEEIGTRGMWFEKRLAFVGLLKERGHTVDYIGRMTKPSRKFEKAVKLDHDVLFIEFGSDNTLSYGEDLEETLSLVKQHRGLKVFLCDDPDLPFFWRKLAPEDLADFQCWQNCKRPQPFGGQPESVPSFDFPFSSIQKGIQLSLYYLGSKFVYIGRPGGREEVIRGLIEGRIPWAVYGDQKHWDEFGISVSKSPAQPMRAQFYNRSFASLVLADKKHKKLAWRTGRAYHSVLAGCPALVEADHPGLDGFAGFSTVENILDVYKKWQAPSVRKYTWEQEIRVIKNEREQAIDVLEGVGL